MTSAPKGGESERDTHRGPELDNLNIYQRIDLAYREIASADFSKSGTVQGAQSYKFVPISQILDVVRKAHAKYGVKVIFGKPEYDSTQFEKRWDYTKKGNYGETTWHAAVGHIDVRIYGKDKDDRIKMVVPFEAQDNSDKLTNKIITNAERCLYRTLYAIDEGEGTDPEAYNEPMGSSDKDIVFGKVKDPAETVKDRPIETIKKSIESWVKDPVAKPAIEGMEAYYGPRSKWPEKTWRETYAACVRKFKENGGRA